MNEQEDNNKPLFREDYNPEVPNYEIEAPEIASGSEYYFTTDSGLRYQVLFAKKSDNYLENIINFSVLNDEFEDEYSATNRGEVYRVIATVAEIIRTYHRNHGYSVSYEFSGEHKAENKDNEISIRSKLYYRKAKALMHDSWSIELMGNKVVVFRKKDKNGRAAD